MICVDHEAAKRVLAHALNTAKNARPCHLSSEQQQAIALILLGDHLTFRYILVTALLAKATDSGIHTRSLQAGAALDGSYDARSLCHKVLVPFEREHLSGKLGASNEPYLNKPARFPSVEKTNAVRAGRDRELLYALYDLLEELNEAPALAEEALTFALSVVLSREGAYAVAVRLREIPYSMMVVWGVCTEFLSDAFGGETAAAVTGAILAERFGDEFRVEVHPANQAGSSSREVADIDVYSGECLVLPVEVKDKPYTAQDVDHAVRKAADAGARRLLFAFGRHVAGPQGLGPDDIQALIASAAGRGIDLAFQAVDTLAESELALFSESARRRFLERLTGTLREMRARDDTKRRLCEILERAKLLAG